MSYSFTGRNLRRPTLLKKKCSLIQGPSVWYISWKCSYVFGIFWLNKKDRQTDTETDGQACMRSRGGGVERGEEESWQNVDSEQ